MTKALELAKFGRESAPTGVVVGDTDTQTLSSKTFSDMPVFSSGTANTVAYLNASKVLSSSTSLSFDGSNLGIGVASPAATLDVYGGASGRLQIYSSASGNFLTSKVAANTGYQILNYLGSQHVWGDGTNTRMVLDTSGNVGVGTITPGSALYVKRTSGNSGIYTDYNGTNVGRIEAASNGNLYIGLTTGSGDIAIGNTANTSVINILSSGNVGIGTTNPSTNLTIGNGASGSGLGVYLSRGAVTNFFESYDGTKRFIGGVDPDNAYVKIGSLTNHPVGIVQGNGPAIYIDTNKNVGIGRTDPYKPLDIKTTASASGTYYLATIGGSSYVSGYAVALGFDPEGYGYRNKIGIIAEGTGAGYSRGKLHIAFHALNNSTEASIADAKVTFLENGYIGIGTTDPQSMLTINSGGTDNVANATINQTTDFAATSRAGFSGLTNNNGGFYFGMGANGSGIPAGFGFFREGSGWNTALAFYTNNQTSGTYSTRAMQEKMRLNSDGALIIGANTAATAESRLNTYINSAGSFLTLAEFRNIDYTSSTRSFIRVRNGVSAGSSSSAYFGQGQDNKTYIIANNSARGGDIVIDGGSGYTGIGTSSPAEKLDVNGNIKFGSNSGIVNTLFYWQGNPINLCSYFSGTAGTSMLVMIHGHGDVAASDFAVYHISIHYNGNLNSATKIAGTTYGFDVSNNYLRVISGPGQNWSYSATIIRNDQA
jgi:hypothetical protein